MPRYGEVISHWHHLADDFTTSGRDFYAAIERRLKDRCVPEMATERHDWKEGGMLSANREYLRLRRGRYVFDVCAAPYGNSFFFSWWLSSHVPAFVFLWACGLLFGTFFILGLMMSKFGFFMGFVLGGAIAGVGAFGMEKALQERGLSLADTISVMPLWGTFYARYMRPVTYYSLDTAAMFQESVSRAINEEINALLTAQGLRALSPEQTKPKISNPAMEILQALIPNTPLGTADATHPS